MATPSLTFENRLYYFGCRSRVGHYLDPHPAHHGWEDRMIRLDGDLAPLTGDKQIEHIAQPWRLTGFTPIPYSALSWWDRSVDHRPGSNIILWAPGHEISAVEILIQARQEFRISALRSQLDILPDWRHRTWTPK